jgi:uncharacterized protein YcsI (UPF0317 family)
VSGGDLSHASGKVIRSLCRSGAFSGSTAGLALGYTQANLVILRKNDADDFAEFCRLNPRPCPLLETTEAGQYEPTRLAPGADLRTDLPRYRVYQGGVLTQQPTSIVEYWHDDSVAFLLGCSFTFEAALLKAGVPVRHIKEGKNVPMFRSSIPCRPAGRFAGPMVVSMRPMTPHQARLAARITAAFPRTHGAPVQIGQPETIGITDLAHPDYGDAVTIRPGEIPIFWACGVTPVEAILRARPALAITHDPGHMFVSDLREESFCEEPPP